MATANSLTGLDWLVRTYAPPLLIVCGRDAIAGTLSTLNPITTTARINAAQGRLDTFEAGIRAEIGPEFDAFWQQAVDYVLAHVNAGIPVSINEMMADPDQTVKQALKTCLRALELVACKWLADGGLLPP
jgi:hypothetical protein